MHLEPLEATFGATVTEIDLEALDLATWEELHAAWLEHALLIFPGQFLDRDGRTSSPAASAGSSSRPPRSPTSAATARSVPIRMTTW